MDFMTYPDGFYVYAHKKATTGEIFYIGKGIRRRAWKKQRGAMWRSVVAKHGLIVEILRSGLSEPEAFGIETNLIGLYGRRDIGTGALINMTNGGDGAAGNACSDAKRQKLREHFTGLSWSPEKAERMRDVRFDPEIQRRRAESISRAKRGIPMSDAQKAIYVAAERENRERRVEAMRRAVCRPVVCLDLSVCFRSATDAVKWLTDQGKKISSSTHIASACKGKRNTAAGYRWSFAV